MKHVKFVLSKDLDALKGKIDVFNGRIRIVKEDLGKLQVVLQRLLKEEVEVVKALSLLEGL